MHNNYTLPNSTLPFKSVAIALLFSSLLGPIGLLYASFWGGLLMIFVAIIAFSCKFIFPIILMWLICCIWSVGATESYNKKLFITLMQAYQNK